MTTRTALRVVIWMCVTANSGNAAASTDFGVPRALTALASTDTGSDHWPQVVAGVAGTWIAAWGSQELTLGVSPAGGPVFARSTDNGATWTSPQLFRPEQPYGFPTIATNGAGVWVAAWAEEGMYATTSLDDGVTWGVPVEIFASVDGSQGPYSSISTDGAGTWVVAWPSTETLGGTTGGADEDILFSRSTDNGMTWSPAALLNSNGGTGFQEYGNPQLANDGADTWVATWDTLAESWVARSIDDGATWSAPVRVSPAVLALNNRSHPHLDTDGAGRWVVVFELEDVVAQGAIGFSVSSDNGASWSTASVLHPYFDAAHQGHSGPAIVHQGAGTWQVVWSASNNTLGGSVGDNSNLFTSYSRDNGLSWSTPAALLSSARTEDTDQFSTSIACSTDGRTVVAWTSPEGLDGALGDDQDILFAQAVRDCPTTARNDCLTTTKASGSKLTIKDGISGRDSIAWSLREIQETTAGDWGDPLTIDGFALCLYERVGGFDGLVADWDIRAGGTCGSKPCWEVDAESASFGDRKQQFGPAMSMRLRAGEDGGASLRVSVKGPASAPPLLPLETSTPVQIQLVNLGTGTCWGGVHDQAKRNAPDRFQSVSD